MKPWNKDKPRLSTSAEKQLREENAELRAALKECSFRLAQIVAAVGDFSDANAKVLDTAQAALAKAEGR